MSERKEPSNTVAEIMRMCEEADLKDLFIIMDQVEQDKQLYTPSQLKDVLFFISARRKKLTNNIDKRWDAAKEKLGL
jgi:hypothetical protein